VNTAIPRGVVLGVVVVRVKLIGVPFLKPVTTVLVSLPRNDLKREFYW
jgi:hypothetical protein